jgi:hypothetical protein
VVRRKIPPHAGNRVPVVQSTPGHFINHPVSRFIYIRDLLNVCHVKGRPSTESSFSHPVTIHFLRHIGDGKPNPGTHSHIFPETHTRGCLNNSQPWLSTLNGVVNGSILPSAESQTRAHSWLSYPCCLYALTETEDSGNQNESVELVTVFSTASTTTASCWVEEVELSIRFPEKKYLQYKCISSCIFKLETEAAHRNEYKLAGLEPFREAFVAMAIIYGYEGSANLALQSRITRSVVAWFHGITHYIYSNRYSL